jgi:hypothetical protein
MDGRIKVSSLSSSEAIRTHTQVFPDDPEEVRRLASRLSSADSIAEFSGGYSKTKV